MAIVWLALAAVPAPGQAPHAQDPPRQIPRATSAIVVDGVLDEAAWEQAWCDDMRFEVRPGENVPPPVRTEVLVTYDDQAVYFGFRAHDPNPDAIRARLSPRDSIGADDWVSVVLDTFNDGRRSFTLVVNPLGVQEDLIESNRGGTAWDGVWESAGRITDWGYVVEMRVPFSTLRFQRTDGSQIWGFDAVRSVPRLVRHHIGYFPRDRNLNCYFCQTVKIEGFEGVSPGRNLEVAPTVTAVRTDIRDPSPGGGLVPGSTEGDLGLTVRWGVTPNLTLSGTVNPDFSQVEADALQLDLNEPFALSLEEKRPFFQEGSDFFSTPFTAVYTRSIREPAWGAKLTGKENGRTVGTFLVRDDVTNVLLPGSQSSRGATVPGGSTGGAVRLAWDLGQTATLGVLTTARDGRDYHNRVGGFDGDLRLSDNDRIRFQVLGSDTRYPEAVAETFGQPAGDLRDWAGEIRYNRDTRTLDLWASLRVVGEEFRTDLGFLPQVDVRRGEIGADRTWIPGDRGSWFTSLNLMGLLRVEETTSGDLLARESQVQFTYEGPMQSHAVGRLAHRRETFAGQEFSRTEVFLHHCMKAGRHTQVFANLTVGDQIDFASARLGRRVRINPGVSHRFGRHLSLDLSGTWERLVDRSLELFTATVAESAVAYHFSTRTFLRAIVQYVDYDAHPAVDRGVADPRSRRLLSQVLCSYMLNPQTVVFLGYSDASLGDSVTAITRAQRTFFAKLGYAWMM